MSISQNKDILFLKLAFQQAEINLGSTSLNPSVGCVVVKNNSVISSGRTSLNGRPHAEANALKKKNKFQWFKHIHHTRTMFSLWKNTSMCEKYYQ